MTDPSTQSLAISQAPSLPQGSRKDEHDTSTRWQVVIERYYAELRSGGVKDPAIAYDLWSTHSPDDLLQQINELAPADSRTAGSWARSVQRLEPIVRNISQFLAVMTLSFGVDGQFTAIIWGSIRLIVKFGQPVLPELIDMFADLGRALARFHKCAHELSMAPTFERAVMDTYREVIIFCAHSIAFCRNNNDVAKSRSLWSDFEKDFSNVISNIHRYYNEVLESAEMVLLAGKETNAANTMETIKGSQVSESTEAKAPCYMIPCGINLKFFGRSSERDYLEKILRPKEKSDALDAVALYGTGGVGKTQVALNYANTFRDLYDVVAWIPAKTQIEIVQAVEGLAAKLGLLNTPNDKGDDYQSIAKAKDWLNTSDKTFLLIFDDVAEDQLLELIWPASNKGSVIITSRSQSLARRRVNEMIHIQCFPADTGLEVLYSLAGVRPSDGDDEKAAKELLELLGGLPLALVHATDYMRDRGYSYQEFLPFYKKFASKIYARAEAPLQYEHTLATVWDTSFQSLSPESKTLLNVLTFFDPDLISEFILSHGRAEITEPSLQFLSDEFEFGEAVIGLTKSSLVHRLSSQRALSIPRLVHFTVFSKLAEAEKEKYFDYATRLLFHSFPNTWNEWSHHQGHSWASWETSGAILPHIGRLMTLTAEHLHKPSNVELFAELIFRAGTYLWETEQPSTARGFFEFGLRISQGQSGRNCAQAYRVLGHIAMDLAQPKAALSAYERALRAREAFEEPNSPPIADVYDSIACSYTEQGNTTAALEYLSKATAIHHAHNPLQMGRTQAIYAMTFLRAGQPYKALTALQKCWELQGLTEEQVAQSKYPKHSGDIVLLSRIKYALGLKKEAQELASRSISIRRGHFGDSGPRVADSMFIVARMLEADEEEVLAAKLLRGIVDMSRGVPEMEGHLSRALWFLAGVEEKMGDYSRTEQLRVEARTVRSEIQGRETADEDTDDSFMGLVGWMLW